MNPFHRTLSIILLLSSLTIPSLAQNQFQNAKTIAAAAGYKITPLLGDYDGDGDMDILGTGSYVRGGTSSNTTVLFRNDDGEFVVIDTPLPWFYYGGMLQWADLDNDNDLDIIAGGCTSYCYNSKMMSIYRNDGADRFTLITGQTNLIGGKLFTLVDYDHDGLIDIEIATQSNNDDSVIGHLFYKNTGNFTFQKTFELPVTAGELTWGDLDNDGWQDFVLLDNVYQNLHNGTFQAFPQTVTMQQNVRHFIFDADDDGDQDVITSKGMLMKNDGAGRLSFGPIIIPYDYVNSLLIADFDGDGDQDMAASGGSIMQGKTQLFRSNGGQTFTPEDLNEQYAASYQLTLADIDNDKDPDILLSGVFTDDIVILENGLTTELSKPGAPVNLHASSNAGLFTFSWDAATDQEQSSLRYNMYLMHGDNFKITPNADTTTGVSFIPGIANASSALQLQISNSALPEGYFRWSVQAVDDELNTSRFATPQEFTLYKNAPPNAPTGLSHTVVDLSVSLAWTDHSNDESGFTIERSSLDGNTGFAAINQVPSNTVAYIDNTVLSRGVYFYRIRLDGSAAVAYSNVIRVETASTIGTKPTNVAATAVNSASVRIDWQFSGTGITSIVVERSPDDKKHFEVVGSVNADQFSYTDHQLESGNTYYYRLYAISGKEVSDYSDIVNLSLPLKEFNKIELSSLTYESTYIMSGIAWGDYDNDGYDDLFLGYMAQLFRNEGDGTFKQITETGIPTSMDRDAVAVWGDYDNDGFLDLFYYNYVDRSSVYRGHGDGTFTKLAAVIDGDRSEITNATWVDFDLDGDLDLSMTGGHYVYRYDGNDTFVRVDLPGGIPAGYYNTSVASWADYDDDGDPDVFLGNYGKDEFFRNDGDGSFTAITDQRITADYNYDCCPTATPTALWTDFNNDRKLDLTVLHAGAPIYAYANRANTLDSAFYHYEYNWESWKNLFWTDYDSDGDLDLFAMGQYNVRTSIWENKTNQPFRRLKGGPLYDYVSTDAAFSWNDFDNDGYSDLFQFDENHQVYKNLPNGNSWIKIRLKGRASNSTGLGAKVLIKSNDGWQRSDVTTHHSYRVQQGFMSLFGLGKATQVDSVMVLWPSGNRQYLTHSNVNQVIVIDENNAQEKIIQAPSNLTAEVGFPSSVTLTWTDRSDDETGFVIEMMTGEGQFTEAGTVGSNITSFKLSGLSMGVKYKFRVRTSPNPNNRWTNIVETQIRLFKEVFGGDLTTFQSKPEGVAWGDPDGDGDPDLFVGSESFEPDAIYYNEDGAFARKALRNTSNYSRQAQWVDYDNDGFQDLHISVGGSIIASAESLNDVLYKNDGTGQLIEQTGHILASDGYPDFTAAWGDLNKDGYLDMIASRPNSSVFLNVEGTLSPRDLGLSFQSEGLVLLSDLDNDRDLDVIAAGYYDNFKLFQNNNGQFTLRSNSGVFGSPSSFVLEDFDNDGGQDLLIVDQTLRLFLLDPVSKMFTEKPNVFPALGAISKVSAGDFDNNGFVDVFVTGQSSFTNNSNRIFLNHGDLTFTSLADPILDLNLLGTALADANRDGRLDVVTLATDNNYNTHRYLLQGAQTENHWLRVKLKGGVTNKFGVGAKIRLFTGNASQVREIRSGSGGTFSDEQVAHFGLGSNTSIEYIKVEWPSGENQWIANPSIDTEMIVEQENTVGPPAPESPGHLLATIHGPRYIDLQWTDNSNNEKSFRIERAKGTASFETFRIVPANTTSYTDSTFVTTAQTDLDIKYRVVAISYVTVESDPSNEALVSLITGIDENLDTRLMIYPQPASSQVFVRSERLIQHISIIGVRGEMITDTVFNGSREVEVPLHGLAPGIYIMAITDDKETHMRRILVVPGH
jgi:uncharacterized protein YuzB (UPF0349 family)